MSSAASPVADYPTFRGDAGPCDVAYFDSDAGQLAGIVAAETDRGNRYIRAHAEHYDWTFFADPDKHLRLRQHAAADFAADISRNPHRYVPGRLPTLPFPDAGFDLVLGSHLHMLVCHHIAREAP